MEWEKHFKLNHQRFVVPGVGEINAKKNLSEELLLKAFKKGCPFIELTLEGEKKFLPQETKKAKKEKLIEPETDTNLKK